MYFNEIISDPKRVNKHPKCDGFYLSNMYSQGLKVYFMKIKIKVGSFFSWNHKISDSMRVSNYSKCSYIMKRNFQQRNSLRNNSSDCIHSGCMDILLKCGIISSKKSIIIIIRIVFNDILDRYQQCAYQWTHLFSG